MKIYAEIGIGNESFLSTEFEKGKQEYRLKKFILPERIEEIYLRIWIFKRILVISFFKGIFLKRKDKSKFKFLIGIGGKSDI